MKAVVKRVDLTATFSRLKVGDTVDIGKNDATENNVRTAASRYSQSCKIELRVSAPLGADTTKVTRLS